MTTTIITTMAVIQNVNEVFLWDEIYGSKIPKPFGASRVVYVKSDWYPNLKNYLKMEPKTFDERTFWNSHFIWMTEEEYVNIKYTVFKYNEEKPYVPPKTTIGWFWWWGSSNDDDDDI